jgi:N-succinyldiaminopimelate aminotransferase
MDLTGPWQSAARGANLLDATDGSVQPTVFARMSALAAQLGAMNLGQGFPDTNPPEVVAEVAVTAIRAGVNQYPPGPGMPGLREAICAHQERHYGLTWDPASEVLVTTGATEAIAASVLALVGPGDEVLTLEPFYDSYAATIALAGGVHRTVPLTSEIGADGDLHLGVEPAAVRAAITDRTRVILLNTPHNPTGIVLGREVLRAVVAGAVEHDAIIVSDEVYEHLTFDVPHVPIATLPGARIAVKQWLTYASGAPFQPAVAAGLGMSAEELRPIAEDLRARRDLLLPVLREVGFRVSVPDAGYFVVADAEPLGESDAKALSDRLAREAGVVAIPVSAFHRPESTDGRSRLRFAFCKDDVTLETAAERLRVWASRR